MNSCPTPKHFHFIAHFPRLNISCGGALSGWTEASSRSQAGLADRRAPSRSWAGSEGSWPHPAFPLASLRGNWCGRWHWRPLASETQRQDKNKMSWPEVYVKISSCILFNEEGAEDYKACFSFPSLLFPNHLSPFFPKCSSPGLPTIPLGFL